MAKKTNLKLVQPGDNARAPMRLLRPEGMAVWQLVQSEYDVSDAGGVQLLLLACESIDRAEACRRQIQREGQVLRDKRGGIRDHPLIRHETAARALAARLLCKLGLDVEPVRTRPGRPGWPGLA